MTSEELKRAVHTFDFNNIDVVSAISKIVGLRLLTHQFSQGKDHWICTAPDGYDHVGTFAEISCFVRGYAYAWVSAQRNARRKLEQAKRDIEAQLKEDL